MNYFFRKTAIGSITISASGHAITNLCFGECVCDGFNAENIETEIIGKAFVQLNEYLSGSRREFALNIECDGTDFQMSVWNQLQLIPYGATKTYKDIAESINRPKSSLAVGMACSKNPVPIFIPCHRVIGSNGKLTGYSGGIDIKKQLLEIEQQSI